MSAPSDAKTKNLKDMKRKLLTKRLLSLFAIVVLMLMMAVVTGCGSGDDGSTSPATPVNPDKPGTSYTLSLSTSSLNFEYDGGQQTVTVTTNASGYSAQSNQTWCRTSQSGTTLTVTVDANTTTEQRTATITVKTTEGNKQQAVTVTQAKLPEKYCTTNMPDVWVFTRYASFTEFVLQTNIDEFSITSSESWCTAKVLETTIANQKTLVVTVEEYDARDALGAYSLDPPRTATVRIKSDGVIDRTLTVVQNTHVEIKTPELPYVGYNRVLYLSADGESKDVVILANCYSWSATSDADWLTLTPKDNGTLTVTSTPRTDNTARTAVVTVFDEADQQQNYCRFIVADKDAVLNESDYNYGGGTGWD